MYEDEKEEVIYDTLEAEEKALEDKADEILSEHLLVKHLRAMINQEIDKRFDNGPGVNDDIEELINKKLDDFVESIDFRDSVKIEMDNYIDDCYVEVDTTAYITKG